MLSGTLVLVPVINVAAFEAASRGNPLDTFSHDMNRIYPGRRERLSVGARRLCAFRVDDQGRRHGDLHSLRRRAFVPRACHVHGRAAGIGGARNGHGARLGLHDVVVQSQGQSDGRDGRGRQRSASRSSTAGVRIPPRSSSPRWAACWRMRSSTCCATIGCFRARRKYDANRTKGAQEALLAPASGLFLPEPGIRFLAPMKKGDRIATIVNLFGDELAVLSAPADGMIFGLRACRT